MAAAVFSFIGAYLAVFVPVRILLYALVLVLRFLGIRTLMMVKRKEPVDEPDRNRIMAIGIPAAAFAGFLEACWQSVAAVFWRRFFLSSATK